MPRAALIRSGTVVNIVAANPDEVGPDIIDIEAQPEVGIGWTYAGGTFTAPPPAALPVPNRIETGQLKLALLNIGSLDNFEAAIQALPAGQRRRFRIEWDSRPTVRRESPLAAFLGPALGLDDAALDDLFRVADTL